MTFRTLAIALPLVGLGCASSSPPAARSASETVVDLNAPAPPPVEPGPAAPAPPAGPEAAAAESPAPGEQAAMVKPAERAAIVKPAEQPAVAPPPGQAAAGPRSGGAGSPATPLGRIGIVNSDSPGLKGALSGGAIGDLFGAGGPGGSGRGEGIGLGRIGAEAGSGPGQGRPASASLTVRMGTVSVSGRLPPEVVQRIVRQSFGRFRLCYEAATKARPTARGRVVTRFVIDEGGAVETARNDSSEIADPTMIGCVTRVFSSLSFPAPEGGKVMVVYPVVFDRDEGAPAAARPNKPPAKAPARPAPGP